MPASRIIILEESLANKIAAGEVVERPASVVKELVENALDAETTRVEVEIEEAGRRLIRVTDNGWGMTREEAVLALQRHSTSKLKTEEDLQEIHTLGFRGEALPSIAAVSQLTLITRARDSDSGVRLVAEAGEVSELEETAAPPGARISIARLFYNTPARLKFLRSDSSELAHIAEVMASFTFSHPQIGFRLTHDGRELLHHPPSSQLLSALTAFLGRENAAQLLPVRLTLPWATVAGYAGKPNLNRATRSQERFFVNQRWVKSRLLSRAVEEAYRAMLPVGRYPVAVICLELAPGLVDVNVHPAKAEVRFLREGDVFQAVRRAVGETLDRARLTLPVASLAPPPPPGPETKPQAEFVVPTAGGAPGVLSPAFQAVLGAEPPLFTPLAQLRSTYILADSEQGLLVVDQHRAHERVLFERFSAAAEEKRPESQLLAIPAPVHLGRAEADLLTQHLEGLAELGLELEQFGADSFLVRRVPVSLARQDPTALVRDLVDDLATASLRSGGPASLEARRERARISLACKSAVKAGDPLTLEEMAELLRELSATQRPFTCPHGRATVMTISNFELDRRFHR